MSPIMIFMGLKFWELAVMHGSVIVKVNGTDLAFKSG